MDSPFARVKSIIQRLREVLKCRKCLQMKEEDSMLFYHVCDHFFCKDCLNDMNRACPLCRSHQDKPTSVVDDKNILSLYQSLSKFELPSKQDIEKIYESHKQFKPETSNESPNLISMQDDQIQDTPKNQKRSRLNLREKENRKNASVESTGTIVVSSGGNDSSNTLNKMQSFELQITSTPGRGKRKRTPARGTKNKLLTTPAGRGRGATSHLSTEKQNTTPSLFSAGSSKGNTSFNKNNINKRNPKGETQLHLACKKANFTAMTELIGAGASPNAKDNAGWTPLHDSVFSGNMEVIKFLLDNGAKVNVPGLENTTALHEAIAKGNTKMVKLLLDYGADVNAMNIFKETPLDLVTKYKLEEMKEILMEASSKPKALETGPVLESDEELILYTYNLPVEDEKDVNKFVKKFEGKTISSLTSKTLPSHIVLPDGKFQLSWALVSSVLLGCRVVTASWVKDSLTENMLKPPRDYEPSSSLLSGFARARENKLNQLPGLFSGCHFFFGGNFDHYTVKNLTIAKDDLKALVEKNGGAVVKRCPDPESLALEKTVPFHAPAISSIRETSYFIIYQTEKWDPRPKYNMSHMKTLPIEWLACCVLLFELIDPNETELWNNCF